MLQQTRIAVVRTAYDRFLERFPTIAALATADEEEVMAQWSGLGYYRRARSLYAAARHLHDQGRTCFPDDWTEARRLPGVGAYTAAAVLSIAFGKAYAAVDGNVVRVLARLACLPPAGSGLQPYEALAQRILSRRHPGDWNQALMQVGQELCRPRAPRCGSCPLRRHCTALRSGRIDEFPVRKARPPIEKVEVTFLISYDSGRRILLERGGFPFLPKMWLPPLVGAGPPDRGVLIGGFAHAIVRRLFTVRVFAREMRPDALRRAAAAARGPERAVFERSELAKIGRSSLLTKSLALLDAAP